MPSFEVIDIRDAPLAPGMRLLLFPDGMWSVLPVGKQAPSRPETVVTNSN